MSAPDSSKVTTYWPTFRWSLCSSRLSSFIACPSVHGTPAAASVAALSALLGVIWGFTMHMIVLAHCPADAIRRVSYGVYEEELARLEGHRRIWRRVVAGMRAAERVGSVKERCAWPALTPPPPQWLCSKPGVARRGTALLMKASQGHGTPLPWLQMAEQHSDDPHPNDSICLRVFLTFTLADKLHEPLLPFIRFSPRGGLPLSGD